MFPAFDEAALRYMQAMFFHVSAKALLDHDNLNIVQFLQSTGDLMVLEIERELWAMVTVNGRMRYPKSPSVYRFSGRDQVKTRVIYGSAYLINAIAHQNGYHVLFGQYQYPSLEDVVQMYLNYDYDAHLMVYPLFDTIYPDLSVDIRAFTQQKYGVQC